MHFKRGIRGQDDLLLLKLFLTLQSMSAFISDNSKGGKELSRSSLLMNGGWVSTTMRD